MCAYVWDASMCVSEGVHMPQHTCGGQGTPSSSLPCLWRLQCAYRHLAHTLQGASWLCIPFPHGSIGILDAHAMQMAFAFVLELYTQVVTLLLCSDP